MKKIIILIITLFAFASNTQAATVTGSVKMWTSNTIPSGYLLCNGQAVSRTTYASLYNVIGTTYGAGNGSTTFNVPNMAGRKVVGKSSSNNVANSGGSTSVALTSSNIPSHSHTLPALSGTAANAGAHTHSVDPAAASAYALTFSTGNVSDIWLSANDNLGFRPTSDLISNPLYYEWGKGRTTQVASAGAHTHSVTMNASTTGSSGTTTNVSVQNPYVVVNYIIKY